MEELRYISPNSRITGQMHAEECFKHKSREKM
jgi:hypothetical protein